MQRNPSNLEDPYVERRPRWHLGSEDCVSLQWIFKVYTADARPRPRYIMHYQHCKAIFQIMKIHTPDHDRAAS